MAEQDKIRKTLRAFQRAVTAKPTNVILRQSLAHYLTQLGHDHQAIEELEICVKLLAARNNLFAAIACTKRILALDPSRTDLVLFLSRRFAQHSDSGRVAAPVPSQPKTKAPHSELDLEPIDISVLTFDGELDDLEGPDDDALDLNALPAPSTTVEPSYTRVHVERTVSLEHNTLPTIPLFSRLPPDTFMTLLEHLELMHAPPQTSLFVPPDAKLPPEGPALHILVSGQVEARRDGIILAQLGPGDVFGVFAMLTGHNSGAQLIASTPCEILLLRPTVLHQLTEVFPNIRAELESLYRQRLLMLLDTTSIFALLTPAQRQTLHSQFRVVQYPANTLVIAEGSPRANFFLVLFGEVRAGDERFGPGALIGAASAATGLPYPRRVQTTQPTQLFELPRQALRDVLGPMPPGPEALRALRDHFIIPW